MNITKHAFERMKLRNFTEDMLGKLFNGKRKILPAGNGRFRIVGNVDGNYWTLVVEADLYTLITVRRAHEDEIC